MRGGYRGPRPDLAEMNRQRAIGFENQYIPEPNSGCWLWLGAINNGGYGHVMVGKRTSPAHRHSWRIHRGPIPAGACVLHRCDVRCCVNPRHLFLGDYAANHADMMAKGRNHPSRGEANGRAKLTDEQVRGIRSDTRHAAQIAESYGVSRCTIYAIRANKKWRHVL